MGALVQAEVVNEGFACVTVLFCFFSSLYVDQSDGERRMNFNTGIGSSGRSKHTFCLANKWEDRSNEEKM